MIVTTTADPELAAVALVPRYTLMQLQLAERQAAVALRRAVLAERHRCHLIALEWPWTRTADRIMEDPEPVG